MLDLNAYFKRIGYEGSPKVDLQTLMELQRQHLLNIPYENLDVQLERPLDRDLEQAFEKLVTRNRGGWCFEMNAVLGWALETVGFDVTELSGGVARSLRGDSALGNHLVLFVKLEGEEWVVDAGFGDGFFEPIPLRSHDFCQRGFDMKLELLSDGYWRYHSHVFGGAPDFDFLVEPADKQLLDRQCQILQTDENSPFVRALVLQKFTQRGYEIQLGLTAKTITPDGVDSKTLDSVEQLKERLATVFNIVDPGIDGLWPKLVDTHQALFSKP